MVGAGLVARKAIERGLDVKPWVKTSLAPGSKVVTQYLQRSNLLADLEALRFHVVGYGCTSCIGNSGPLPAPIAEAVDKGEMVVASVLSGNRNFEARVHPQVKMNFLMSPMLVVAYALAGRIDIDLTTEPLGFDPNGEPVLLKDIWPTQNEINQVILDALKPEDFKNIYGVIFEGEEQWKQLVAPTGQDYHWDASSTYIKEAPFFQNISEEPAVPQDVLGARVLLKLGDSVTTDHISPAGAFSPQSPAGQYLTERGVERRMFNSYGSRRGNHEIMMRGTFANVRIKNLMIPGSEGGVTLYQGAAGSVPEQMSIYDAAMKYQAQGIPTVVFGGKEYGTGSSRDWAAKGTQLLGVKAVIATSFERIHRSNLIGMGVLPLQFKGNDSVESLGIKGDEQFDITGLDNIQPQQDVTLNIRRKDGSNQTVQLLCRIDTAIEVDYFKHGGILPYVLRELMA
jgi:aconitate hydratase